MKNLLVIGFALVLIVFGSVLLFADEKSPVVVKGSSVTTGVVIVDVQFKGKTAELQCNEGGPSCNKLKPGDYVMVQLPKNHGMYDCANVEVYSPAASDNDEKIGAYCLIQK
jgi:hypothetical protein